MTPLPPNIGRYRIVRLLGSGAMGDVYLAEDPNIDRELAIKTVRVVGGTPDDVHDRKRRLLREAKAAGKFVHPNVVTLFDADESEGTLYLAFEYVPPGIDLAKRMTTRPQPTLRQALRWVREIAQALQFAHERGIVHRDIKPSNVLIAADDTAKVADFGIAKLLGPGTELTRTGSVVGSPQYMSPEQVRGEDLDGRSDVFSLGVVFYELLCGIRPFGGDTLSTLVFEILSKEPPPVASLRPSLSGPLVALAHRMLAKDRNYRSTAKSVEEDIRKLEATIPQHQLEDTAAPSDADETRRIATAISQQMGHSVHIAAEAPTSASSASPAPGFVPPPPPSVGTGAPGDPTLAASQHPATPPFASAPVPTPPAQPVQHTELLPARGMAASSGGGKTLRNVVLGLGVLGVLALIGVVGLWFVVRSLAPQLLPPALGGAQPAEQLEDQVDDADDGPEPLPIQTASLDPKSGSSAAATSDLPPANDTAAAPGPTASAAPAAATPTADADSQAAAVAAIRDEVKKTKPEPASPPPPTVRTEPIPTRQPPTRPTPPPPTVRQDPEPVRTEPAPEPDPESREEPAPRVDRAEREEQRWQTAAARANREMSTGLRFRFDIRPKDLIVIVRVWPRGESSIVKGQADAYKDGRKGQDMVLPGDGDHLLELVIGGEVQHSILVHASAANAQTTTVSLDLR